MDSVEQYEYTRICQETARSLGVSSEIHPDDFILHFLLGHPGFKSKEQAINYYFKNGADSAQKLLKILMDICGFKGEHFDLLEFASGYGCVTRHIKNTIPFCSIVACDIHQQAVTFIRDKLKTDAVVSASHPDDLRIDRNFDVVFALSFFSHMPKKSFFLWLFKLSSLIRSGGYFIFTTHGMVSCKKFFTNSRFDRDGFYFKGESEQKDISLTEYGTAVVKPQHVFNLIYRIPDLSLEYFRQGFWWDHQDLYVVRVEKSTPKGHKTLMTRLWERLLS